MLLKIKNTNNYVFLYDDGDEIQLKYVVFIDIFYVFLIIKHDKIKGKAGKTCTITKTNILKFYVIKLNH